MISNEKQLYDCINAILEPHGFIKKKEVWYLFSDECISFLLVSKSPYGGQYEEFMGCFLKEILTEEDKFPKYYKKHMSYGIDELSDKELVRKAFNLENHEFKNDEREVVIKELIEKYALPFLKEINSKQGLKEAAVKYKGLVHRMVVNLRSALGVVEPEV